MQISSLGLHVSEEKTEAVVFHGRVAPERLPPITVSNCRISLGSSSEFISIAVDPSEITSPMWRPKWRKLLRP